ncbi:hypothetical protein PG996_000639 [Apiospora saccharicola]|uniref:Dephospho-CoA kinase n=1 Tax=Apiospora saccharicola TaxID=335842 RepID=A0ABR1WIE4_9PEZI
MLFIGLTGSIATGKSTVSSILSSAPYSLRIIDADVLARKVVEPGTSGYNAIVKHFGPTTPDLLEPASASLPEQGVDGKGRPLNRPALVLNGIVHPAVHREMYKALLNCYLRGHWAVVLDIPLLFESALDRLCGVVVVVAVRDPEVQMRRLTERDSHLTPEDARNRVASQMDVRLKARRCEARGEDRGVVVWNDGDRAELKANIDNAMAQIQRRSPGWWNMLLLFCPPLAVVAGAWNFWRNVRINRVWAEQELQEKAKL